MLPGHRDIAGFIGAVMDGHFAQAEVFVLLEDLAGANRPVSVEAERAQGIDSQINGAPEGIALELVNAAGTVADPTRSLWQTGAIALRMTYDMALTMRGAGRIQYLNGASW